MAEIAIHQQHGLHPTGKGKRREIADLSDCPAAESSRYGYAFVYDMVECETEAVS